MKQAITFRGAKGGVGTSTVVALTALELEHRTNSAPIVIIEIGADDMTSILGRATRSLSDQLENYNPDSSRLIIANDIRQGSGIVEVIDTVTGLMHTEEPPIFLIDNGTAPIEGGAYRFTVVSNDFLTLRRLMQGPAAGEALVLVEEESRALGKREVEDIGGMPILATIRRTQEMARAIDAGTLGLRHPRNVRAAFAELVHAIIERIEHPALGYDIEPEPDRQKAHTPEQ